MRYVKEDPTEFYSGGFSAICDYPLERCIGGG